MLVSCIQTSPVAIYVHRNISMVYLNHIAAVPLISSSCDRRHTPYGNQTDYRIFELNKRLQNWTEVRKICFLDHIQTTVVSGVNKRFVFKQSECELFLFLTLAGL